MRSARNLFASALALTLLLTVSPAGAGITYNDGMTHTINGMSPDVTLSNNTTLQVISPAAITAAAGINGITGTNSNVALSGGSVTGGASGISLQGGTFTATGGTVTGGAGEGDGLALSSATATIMGGTFSGGGTSPNIGIGLIFSDFGAGNLLTISGGTFNGGVGGHSAVEVTLGLGTATISGGSFQAATSLIAVLSSGANINISGGSFGGAISATAGVGGGSLNFFGGGLTFTPTLVLPDETLGTLTGTLGGQAFSERVVFSSDGPIQVVTAQNGGEISFVGSGPAAVPEPVSVLMLGVGLAVVGFASRLNRRRS